ncbi:carboxymuconolactone decarboxylase family protein [Nonomuraea sp. NPDC050691]|uniref:carboxymuconolactone decarboxylase family protein n=1 Tax=Nonomuraea sp. NPDC050691 TaxID=3155661 RepID=UPI0033E90086
MRRRTADEKIFDDPAAQADRRRTPHDRRFRPKLARLTDDVLFEDVWNRTEPAARDRSLITVAALVAGGDADQLRFHLGRARENGVTETELIEAITHLAFYVGWPKAMTAITTAKQVFA